MPHFVIRPTVHSHSAASDWHWHTTKEYPEVSYHVTSLNRRHSIFLKMKILKIHADGTIYICVNRKRKGWDKAQQWLQEKLGGTENQIRFKATEEFINSVPELKFLMTGKGELVSDRLSQLPVS